MKKILIPCDFSEPAQEAFNFGITIAQQSQGEIHVLYVIDVPFLRNNPIGSYANVLDVKFMQEIEHNAFNQFQKLKKTSVSGSVQVIFKITTGPLVLSIENYIRDNHIDLVLMGAHSSTKSFWGTNSAKVVRHSPVPVITIRETLHKRVENIVVPVSTLRYSRSLDEELKKLQAFFQARIHFVWINTPIFFKTDAESTREMQHYAEASKFENYTINTRSDYNIEAGIFRFAKDKNADMIAMGTHAWKDLIRNLTGSIAEDMVSHASLPIWTFDMSA